MDTRFLDRVAIVTGGVSGIGAAITERLVAEGASVVVADINEELIASAEETFGERVTGIRADVTQEEDVEGLIASAVERHGTLDAMFNVAGGARMGTLVDLSYEDFDFTVRLNLHSAFLGTQHAARRFIAEGKRGAIVNVASLNATVPAHLLAAYTMSKAGAEMLGRQAALELGEHGIRVNTVSPGLTATPMTDGLLDAPGVPEAYMERIPLNRPAEPAEIAAAATFLASDDAAYITGDNLIIDGGWATTGYPDLRPMLGG